MLWVTVGAVYVTVWVEMWRRQLRSKATKVIDAKSESIDANAKPEIPKDVLSNADIDVLSHSQLLESVQNSLNNTNGNANTGTNVSANTKMTEPVKIGDTKLQIGDTRSFSVGMNIIIGTGPSMEIGVVQGLGSIILNEPVNHNHHKGTLIRGFKSIDDMNAVLKLEDAELKIQSQLELRINAYWHSLFPPIYLDDESFFKQFKREMLKHHGFISMICTKNNFHRLVYVLRFLTIMSIEVFLLAIMYAVQYPAIDPNCSYMRNYNTCHGIVSKYDKNVHYCRWVERYMTDYETKEIVDMGFCTFLEPVIDLYTFVYFSLYVSVVSIPVYILIDSMFEDMLLQPLPGIIIIIIIVNIMLYHYHHHYYYCY